MPTNTTQLPDREPASVFAGEIQALATAATEQEQRWSAGKARWEMLNSFVDKGLASLRKSPAASLVWLVLFRHTRNGVVKMSQQQIADQIGYTSRQVRRAIGLLEDKGLIKVSPGDQIRGASRYKVLGPKERTRVSVD